MKITIRSDRPPVDASLTLADRGLQFAHIGEGMEKYKIILSDPYDPDTNPDGFINMGVAENVRDRSWDIFASPLNTSLNAIYSTTCSKRLPNSSINAYGIPSY